MIEHDRVRPSLATLGVLAGRLHRPLSELLEDAPPPLEQAGVAVRRAEALLRQHRFDEALELSQAASAAAGDGGDPHLRVRAALALGQALAGLRRLGDAEGPLQDARGLAESLADLDLIAQAANALGFCAYRARQFARARALFQEGVDRLRGAGVQDGESLGKLLSNLGRVYVELGLPVQALECLREALGILGRAADPAHRALLLFNLGVAAERQQAFAEADGYLLQAEALLRLHENLRLLGTVKRSTGILRLGQGRLDEAERELLESRRLAAQCGDVEGEAQTLVELARLETQRSRPEAAQALAGEALALARRIDDEAEAARAIAADAGARRAAGRLDEAAARYAEAITAFERLAMASELSEACRDLGFVLLTLGRHEAAARQFARAFEAQTPAPPVRAAPEAAVP